MLLGCLIGLRTQVEEREGGNLWFPLEMHPLLSEYKNQPNRHNIKPTDIQIFLWLSHTTGLQDVQDVQGTISEVTFQQLIY